MRTKRVVVEKWNPQWKYEYEKIVASLGKDIIYNSIKIEHVGSTSVEGLSAKPVIDLDIVIEKDKFAIIKELLNKKFLLRYVEGEEDISRILLEYPVPDSIKEAPPEGWKKKPEWAVETAISNSDWW